MLRVKYLGSERSATVGLIKWTYGFRRSSPLFNEATTYGYPLYSAGDRVGFLWRLEMGCLLVTILLSSAFLLELKLISFLHTSSIQE